MLLQQIDEARRPMPASGQFVRWLGLLFASLWLIACSESPQQKIVGKWQAADTSDGNIVEFYKDGTVAFDEPFTGVSVNGKYTFLNDQKIKIELSGILAIAGATIYTITLADNQMTLKAQNGANVTTYDKIE